MRILSAIAISCLLAGGAFAQRGGGHGGGMGGGMRSGGFSGGAVRSGGYSGGAVHGGSTGVYRGGGYGGYVGNHGGYYGGYRGGYYGYRGGYYGYRSGYYLGGYWPYYGLGWGWGYRWPGYYGYSNYPYDYPYDYGYANYAGYSSQPNVTVVYPQTQQAPNTIYMDSARPVTREYDEYGQETAPRSGSASSPVYLIAFRDQVIRAAISYSVSGSTLRYTTPQHEEKQVPLDSIDRDLTLRLNRERRVAMQLP